MLLLDRQTGATAPPRGEANRPGVTAGRIQLRLRANGQVLELPPGKTTIGSSPRCNVRIEQPGVQPLHCLIVEGPEGLRVRSWVTNTSLNGMPFEESALAVGDCLSLGPVELDIIDPFAEKSQPEVVEAPVAKSKDAELVRAGRDQARSRSRRLLDTLRHERATHHELCQQVLRLQESHLEAIAEQNELSGKLENCLAELAAARRQLDEFQSVEAARQQLAERNEQLGFEIGELSAQINELTYGQTDVAKDRQKLLEDHAAFEEQHRQLIEAHNRLQCEFGQVASDKAAADEQNGQLAEQKLQLQREFDRLSDEKNAFHEERRQLSETISRLQGEVVQLANEKAVADEQNQQLAQQKSQLQHEVGHLTDQKGEVEAEREGLLRQNEHLMSEAREQAWERGTLTDERTALCHERSELRQENETLRARITQLDDENSALAVGKLTLVEQCDVLNREVEQLRVRVTELSDENATLAAAKATLGDEQGRLVAEQKRLAELEREMGVAVADRENTSAELYRALLQLAEVQERDVQSKAIIEAYELLGREHDHLHEEADQLKEQIQRLSEERAGAESAWQALSAEAATLGESQQRLADENATLVARLDEARQQLEMAQQGHAASASLEADLERERAAKLQAEADIAAAIADGERRLEEQERRFAEQAQQFAEQSSQFNELSQKHAEQAREFAESINALERQLAAASETRDSLARAREDAQLLLADAESQRGEQLRRIQELEIQLAAAEERAAKAAEIAANQSATGHTENSSHVAGEQSAEFRWSSARRESTPYDGLNAGGEDGAPSGSSFGESTTGEAAWDRPASAAEAWHSEGAEVPASDSAVERTAEACLSTSQSGAGAEEPNPWAAKFSPPAAVDASSFGDANNASPAEQPMEDAVSSRQSSAWNEAAAEPENAFAEPGFAKPEESVQPEVKPESGPAAKHEPTSFIERYSHLFAEDGAASGEKPVRPNELLQARPIAPVVARPEAAILDAKKSEEEESIEQYMAKLLQRVRGESEGGKAAREQPSRMPLSAPAAKQEEGSAGHSEPLFMAAPESRADDQAGAINQASTDSGELVKRRVPSPASATNLGALRALANETARMAISQHELRKLRRNAVTKTIVATLAGVTSLWLMLDSPDWRNVQFLTACGALLVAAYWAAEAFRTLLNSMRIKAYEGPEEREALPIDVETRE